MNKSVLQKSPKVIITGGSGLIGRNLTSLLLREGYVVSHLSRSSSQFGKVRVFRWDPEKRIIDPVIFDGVEYIIHLAGANIGGKPWTKKRKKEIVSSRVDSEKFLYDIISDNEIKLKGFISASAAGYYGSVTSDKIFKEEDPPGKDFLGSTCKLWEDASDLFAGIGVRVVKVRTAVVMEKSDSALSKLLKPARFGIFPRLGDGCQFMPWIHIEDLCGIYLKAVKNEKMEGVYNAVAPEHITQSDFMRTLAMVMKRPFFHPPLQAIFLKIILGEMSDVVLRGSRISSEKIINTGYQFSYSDLKSALKEILLRI